MEESRRPESIVPGRHDFRDCPDKSAITRAIIPSRLPVVDRDGNRAPARACSPAIRRSDRAALYAQDHLRRHEHYATKRALPSTSAARATHLPCAGCGAVVTIRAVTVDDSGVERRQVTGLLVIVLAVTAGVVCWWWQVHDLGRSCGTAPGFGLPSFPVVTAFVVLVGSPTFVVGVSAVLEHRRPRAVVGFIVGAAALSTVAFGVAWFAFLSSRNCFS